MAPVFQMLAAVAIPYGAVWKLHVGMLRLQGVCRRVWDRPGGNGIAASAPRSTAVTILDDVEADS
jgi:hypothetical protein